MAYLDDIRRVGRSRSRLIRLTATRLSNIDREGGVSVVEKCVKLVSNGAVSGKWPEERTWLELTATASHQETPKVVIAGESKRHREEVNKTLIYSDEVEKLLLLQDIDGEAFIGNLKPRGNIDADKWEKLLRAVHAEAVGSELKPRGGTNEATEGANTLSVYSDLDADDDDASKIITMAPRSSIKQGAFVPLLRNLGTAVTVVLAVIATMFLTELLLCISLSVGPVIVAVRGVVALGASTVRRVSAFAQVTKQVAVNVDCYLAEIFSQRKRVAVTTACVATTTVFAVCTTRHRMSPPSS